MSLTFTSDSQGNISVLEICRDHSCSVRCNKRVAAVLGSNNQRSPMPDCQDLAMDQLGQKPIGEPHCPSSTSGIDRLKNPALNKVSGFINSYPNFKRNAFYYKLPANFYCKFKFEDHRNFWSSTHFYIKVCGFRIWKYMISYIVLLPNFKQLKPFKRKLYQFSF